MGAPSKWSGTTRRSLRRFDLLSAIAVVVIGLAVIQIGLGAVQVGVTVDEPMHTYRTNTLLETGWYVPGHLLEDGKPSADPIATPFVYGPGFSMPTHLFARILGIDEAGQVSEEREGWAFRHLMLAMIALLTAFSVWLCVKALTGSRRAALWSAAALLCIPIWTGMGMFNVKDLPVAAGYTLFTTGLVLSLTLERPLSGRAFRTVMAISAGGVLLAFGVRFAMWAALAASVLLWLMLLFFQTRWLERSPRDSIAAVASGSLLGLALVVVLYPAVFSNPVELLVSSIRDSSNYPWNGFTLTAGKLIQADSSPFWYLPVWSFAVVPVAIGLFGLVGFFSWVGSAVSAVRRSAFTEFVTGRKAPVMLVVAQLLLLPAASIVSGATIYDGLRQHLYIIPAVAILAGYGFARLWESDWVSSASSSWRRPAMVALAVAALIVPFVEQLRLFPYDYTYVNPVAGIGGVNGRWESDFWAASLREAGERTPPGQAVACTGDLAAETFTNCGPNWVLRFLPDGAFGLDPDNPPDGNVRILTGRRAPLFLPEYCRLEDSVSRRLRFEDVVMSRILACDAAEVSSRFVVSG